MELKVSAHEPSRSPSVSESNPDEKEISDDDDDDRNHKHRRRDDARSQSQERDITEHVSTKPYKRVNKPFENGNIHRESSSQSNEPWKRRVGFTQSSHGPSDMNQRIRGRGRDPNLWNQRDSRFNPVDIASQIVQQGPVPPGLFGGRGLPNVSNAYGGAAWGAFGLVPGIPNGGLDPLHPLGMQGTYRGINSSMNMGMGLARQRCRDFEEQGFCLRGDMCPMEHGVNRIVVEDVQSLSQFNLPVSLQNPNLSGPQSGPGSLPTTGGPTNSSFNPKSSHIKTNKRGGSGASGNGQGQGGINDTFIDSAATGGGGSDFYDPDQPLWGNDSQTPALQSLNQSKVKENGPLLDPGPSNDHRIGPVDGPAIGRTSTTKNKTEIRENIVPKETPNFEKHESLNNAQKRNEVNSSLKTQSGNPKSIRKPSQKAQCTLFVNGVPLPQNKRESLISHFHKFGEVIDIHIPTNSERAFVQFSKREEAEAALVAPDAVMGNRFIKLFWANRDNIPVNPIPPRGIVGSSALRNDTIAPGSDHSKTVVINGPKAPPPSQKKLESLEVLKEELRKKQEMLDQKRNDFRRKLEKLAKQATGLKGEIEPEQAAKRQKLQAVADSTKAATSTSSVPETNLSTPRAETTGNGNKLLESAVPQSSKSTAVVAPQSSKSTAVVAPPVLKPPPPRPLAAIGSSVVTNRFKLDNRPTAFKIVSTLPSDLADVAILKEHFSPFGDLSKVELDNLEPGDSNNESGTSKYTARVYFTTRHSAEKAFINGKCINGHNMQFSWLKPIKEAPLSTPKGNSVVPVLPLVETSKTDSSKPATSENEESEKVEQMEIVKEHKERDENINAS